MCMEMKMNSIVKALAYLSVVAAILLGSPMSTAYSEVEISNEALQELGSFESHNLLKADETFRDKKWKQAFSEYNSFILEFPRSAAIPYALLRKARCLHHEGKRYEAIKHYTEVLDFFPNLVQYAAPALYHIGQCHWQNGDIDEAMSAFARMADDVDYSKHPLAASAINKLAEQLAKQGKHDRAAFYHRQVSVDFRRQNGGAARDSMRHVIEHYVRRDPSEPELREYYRDVQTFHHHPRDAAEDLETDGEYWSFVRRYVEHHGRFNNDQVALRNNYYRYWAKALEGRFAGWDDYQIDRINYIRQYEQDTQAWMDRLDEQYESHNQDDYDRIVKWIRLYASHPEKLDAYYKKINFEKMSNNAIMDLVRIFAEQIGDQDRARAVLEKVRFAEVSDKDKHDQLLRHLWHRTESLRWIFPAVTSRYKDKDAGRDYLLRYYHWRARRWHQKEDREAGLEIAEQLVNVPEYAKSALHRKAELLHWSGKYDQAIVTYRKADNPPDNLFGIADCLRRQGKLTAAIGQLREIENFFPKGNNDSRAALTAAHYYRDAKQQDNYIASLRRVLKKYPKSPHSSQAHQELERLGERIGGGVDTPES